MRSLDGPDQGGKSASLRSQVRKVIVEELEGKLCEAPPTSGEAWKQDLVSRFGREPPGGRRPRAAARARSACSSRRTVSSAAAEAARSCVPTYQTRQVQCCHGYTRTHNGGLLRDAPAWEVTSATAPVLPSQQGALSRTLWAAVIPAFEERATERRRSVSHAVLTDPEQPPECQVFGQCASLTREEVQYREEIFGRSKIVMRKGGGTMQGDTRK